MELKLTPVSNINVTFTFTLEDKLKDVNAVLTYKTIAQSLEGELVTVSADNALYTALFDGLLGQILTEEDEQEWNDIFNKVKELKVSVKDINNDKEKEMTFYSLWNKAAVIECDTIINEMLNWFK